MNTLHTCSNICNYIYYILTAFVTFCLYHKYNFIVVNLKLFNDKYNITLLNYIVRVNDNNY